MLLELQNTKKTVGRKQSQRAILGGTAQTVFLAEDADEAIRQEIIGLCSQEEVPLVSVETMLELGKACGIQVGASVAAKLKA